MLPMAFLCPQCGRALEWLHQVRAPTFAVEARCQPCGQTYGIPLARVAAVVGTPT